MRDYEQHASPEHGGHQVLATDVRADRAMRSVAAAVSSGAGAEFFVSLTEYVSAALDADLVLVSRLVGPPVDCLQTIAAAARGLAVERSECSLSDVPWPLEGGSGVHRTSDASPAYGSLRPRLRAMPSEDCAALALRGAGGGTIGVMAVFNRAPLNDFESAAAMLTIFGARASAELERLQAETENRTLVTELGSRIRALTLLHEIARTLQHDEGTSVSDWLQRIA